MKKTDKINKDVDDLTSPSNKVLVRSLIFAVVVLFPLLYFVQGQRYEDCKESFQEAMIKKDSIIVKKNVVIDSLVVEVMRQKDSEKEGIIRELKAAIEWQDSVKHILKKSGL